MSAVVITSCEINSMAVYKDGKFKNTEKPYQTSLSNLWDISKAYITNKRVAALPSRQVPVVKLSKEELQQGDDDRLYRLGHSTILMRLNSKFVLTDPVFSDRASPVQWAGPKRFQSPPISIDDLPDIKIVLISHDHYDHLDKHAIQQLKDRVEYFIVPTKVGEYLADWGVTKDKIIERTWWESVMVDDIKLTATPAQHFSGRGLFDRDSTLWASWVINSGKSNIFFGGDSGYFSGFKEIGERFGPFDITLLENGAYNEHWLDIHMLPEQSMQAHMDLQGKAMLPIHNGTFDLALHDWFEPLEKSYQLAAERNAVLITPLFGEAVKIKEPDNHQAWWREVEAVSFSSDSLLVNEPL